MMCYYMHITLQPQVCNSYQQEGKEEGEKNTATLHPSSLLIDVCNGPKSNKKKQKIGAFKEESIEFLKT